MRGASGTKNNGAWTELERDKTNKVGVQLMCTFTYQKSDYKIFVINLSAAVMRDDMNPECQNNIYQGIIVPGTVVGIFLVSALGPLINRQAPLLGSLV